jgi:hypothetical protein
VRSTAGNAQLKLGLIRRSQRDKNKELSLGWTKSNQKIFGIVLQILCAVKIVEIDEETTAI